VRATTSRNANSLGSVKVETSGGSKGFEDILEGREVRNEVRGANGNIISVETNVDFDGVGNHVVKNIHKKDEEGGRERAALFDPSVEVDTNRVGPISSSEAISVIKKSLNSIAIA
jgi:fructose-specific phosphotransferase system component IIB